MCFCLCMEAVQRGKLVATDEKHIFHWNTQHVFYLNTYISVYTDPQMFPHYQTSINYIEATLQTTKTFSLNSVAANVIQAEPGPKQAFFLPAFKHFLWFVSSFLRWILCLGHQELWGRADPSATAIPSRCWGHEDLPHPVWVPSPAGLQELHPPHHSSGNGHPAAGRQPQQSLGYNNHVLGYTTPCTGGYIYTPQTIWNCLCCYGTRCYIKVCGTMWHHT